MATPNQQLHNPGYAEPRSRGNGVSTFLSSVSVLLSTLALVCSGFAAYQVFTWQQTLEISRLGNKAAIVPKPVEATPVTSPTSPNPTTTISPVAATSPAATATPTTTPTTTALASPTSTPAAPIKPGQFVQPAFGNKAQVELLSLKRIKDPQTGNRDVVNLQMRVRRLADSTFNQTDALGIYATTARNPDTSETYKGVSVQRSTGSVPLAPLRSNASADAYVWLRVPEGVHTLDIFVPDTGAFQKVPISK